MLKNEEEELDISLLKECWNQFAEVKKARGYSEQYVALSNARLTLNGTTIVASYDSSRIKQQFDEFKDQFSRQLEKKLSRKLSIQTEVIDRSEEKRKIYTDKDKFEYLAQKYPHLIDLQKTMGLDFEY